MTARIFFHHILCFLSCAAGMAAAAPPAERPNIVFMLADDLGFGELGCYGQLLIATPNIDRLAAEGMRFTQFYSGCHVCAPSRSTLMTGLHTGHTPIRANGGSNSLDPADVTVAEVLKQAGYAAGGFGKWGLGTEDSPGAPWKQGFDVFFGYLHQVHAHFYYPYWLCTNDARFLLPENEGHKRSRYSHDEIQKQALAFIRREKNRPFFCYLPYTLPHVELVAPEDSVKPYRGKWKETPLPDPRPGYIASDEPYATFAGMVSRLDRSVGEVLALLKELKLEDNTVVFFASDNGPQGDRWQRIADFFHGAGPLRGYKGGFYEGGLRVPLIVRWPGRIKPGTSSDHLCAFWDFLPTAAGIAGVPPPPGLDGISFLPLLLGRKQERHEFLYWEMTAGNGHGFAVRMGDWKAVKPKPAAKVELYDLKADSAEAKDLADQRPEVLDQLLGIAARAHTTPRMFPPENPRRGINDYVR
jgi:arylsulfatase A